MPVDVLRELHVLVAAFQVGTERPGVLGGEGALWGALPAAVDALVGPSEGLFAQDSIDILVGLVGRILGEKVKGSISHLDRDKIGCNLIVPGIQGHKENALVKALKMSPHLICL